MPTPAKVKRKRIADYTQDDHNPNQHTERGRILLDESVAQVGLGRSIVVDKNGVILAGNSTQARALDGGFEDALEVETDGSTLVVVKRTDLDLLHDAENKARALTYYDNRISEVGLDWDTEQLLADVNAGVDLKAVFGDDLDALLEQSSTTQHHDAGSGTSQLGELEYRVVVLCQDEHEQAALIERWTKEGYPCQALIS